jgi:hypothetical protein
MKRVEEESKAIITSMKIENRLVNEDERDFNVLYFRATFAKAI